MGVLEPSLTGPATLRARLTDAVLANLDREYPNQIAHLAHGPGELPPPRARHPIFGGCFDWHSAVHSHWALLRLRRDPALRPRIDAAVAARVTPAAVAAELAYLTPRPRFEVPYGLAWLLALCGEATRAGELGESLRPILAPLAALARDRIASWAQALPAPVRSGEHASSAFALSLALDAARRTGDAELAGAIEAVARRHHAADRDAPWAYEPSAYDFVSPALAVAWLMARVLGADFPGWLAGFAPTLGRGLALAPPVAADRADGKLVHWDGLALSRAWMLAEIARALPAGDDRAAAITADADAHGARGVAALDGASYAGLHWLPSFAVYWLDARAGWP